MSPISRTQAWCALTIAMVDRELPAPRQIMMDSEGAVVSLSTADDFGRWADALGADKRQPSVHTTATVYSTSVLLDGLSLVLSAIVTRTPPEPVTEDLTRVREIAEHGAESAIQPVDCEHPWHYVSTPDHEPTAPTCPACGDHAEATVAL